MSSSYSCSLQPGLLRFAPSDPLARVSGKICVTRTRGLSGRGRLIGLVAPLDFPGPDHDRRTIVFEKLQTPEEVFSFKLGAALSMENHTVNMLDDIAGRTSSKELCEILRDHAVETHQHIRNVEECFVVLDEDPHTSRCSVVHALEQDCSAAVKKTDESLVDAVILAAAAELEHYETAVYETLLANAEVREVPRVCALLRQNLQQEQAALRKIHRATRELARDGYATIA
jgi:ferritin-like metal-binding protein YciE